MGTPSRSLIPCILFLIVLLILVCGVIEASDAGAQESSMNELSGTSPTLLANQPGVEICEQTKSKVPNSGFEGGIGVENGWIEAGKCFFLADDPGYEGAVSALISAPSSVKKGCKLLSLIDEIPVVEGRTYDFSAWIKASLQQGNAHLAVTFWRIHQQTLKQVGVPILTDQVNNTQGDWVQVTHWAQAPAGAEYARVEVSLAPSSAGSAWFDTVYLGLSTCMAIDKEDDPDEVYPGSVLTYTIVYGNSGRERATGCQIVETYDVDVDLILTRTEPAPDIGNSVWLIDELGPGQYGAITPVVRVRDVVDERSWLVNKVEILCDYVQDPLSTTLLTRLIIPTSACAIDLEIDERVMAAPPGRTVSYDLGLRNVGDCEGECAPAVTPPPGWGFQLDPETCHLPVNGVEKAELTVDIPEDALVGTCETFPVTASLECELPCHNRAMDREMVEVCVTSKVFLPVIMKDYRDPRWEDEPNHPCENATGPLQPGSKQYGYTNDTYDCWAVESPGGRLVLDFTLDVEQLSEKGIQIWIKDKDHIRPSCYDNIPENGYSLDCPLEEGRHCLVIFTENPDDQGYNTPYILWTAPFR